MYLVFFLTGNVLFYCVSAGQLMIFKKLLDVGVQIETDLEGMTILMEASYEGHLATVKYLIFHAADLRININQTDNANRNALFYAFENSQLQVADFLLSNNAKLEPADHRKSALMCACLKNNMATVSYCLKRIHELGIGLEDTDDKGRNVLFYAVTGGNVQILQLLLESGCHVLASPDDINLLMQAAGKKQLDIGRYF